MTTQFGRKLLRTIRRWMPARPARMFQPQPSPYRIRQELASPYLAGRGIEIGAGANPQLLAPGAEAVLFDVRSRAELAELFEEVPDVAIHPVGSIREHFPRGAPFLIAHHVLEHTPDPIGALRHWHEHVTDGGVVVLSLPDKNACPDEPRLEPPFSHLLYDYLLERGGHAFESTEHALSFNLGWIQEAPAAVKTVADAASWLLGHLFDRDADIHWHAFTQSLAEKTVLAAAHFGGCSVELLAKADFTTTAVRTLGDILLVYRLHRRAGPAAGFRYDIAAELEEVDLELRRALKRVGDPPRAMAQAARMDAVEHYPAWIVPEDRPEIINLRPPFRRESGHCFLASGLITRSPCDAVGHPARSVYALFEDGVALGPAHALHDDIRRRGAGRFSHWHESLYFSSRDNSDPNVNGRRYQFRPA